MILAVALLVGAAGIVGLYSAVTGQSPVDEVKAALSGGTNPGRTAGTSVTEAGQALGADKAALSLGSTIPARGTQGMQPAFAAKVSGLIYEAAGRVTIVSGYRTYQEQAALYAKYLAGTGPLAAAPGTSAHESGLAVDFGGDLARAEQLAPKYGLHQSVPSERWHFT